MKTLSRRINLIILFVLVASLVGVVSAQDFRGKVQGLVTDPSQAAIASATVTLKNINTGVETVRQTDTTGHYLVDYVQPGNYSVSVQAAGFQRAVQENVTVMTAGDVTVNISLKVGGVSETVNVTEEVSTVEFNTSTMTTTVQGTMLKDIPVLARNPFTLALLNPAVVNQYWDVAHRLPFYMWSNGGMDIGGPTGGKNE
ncbi:MAG: carboxypeptidase-like regulatory domain-containing protein [Bryobacteraceae bacterium]